MENALIYRLPKAELHCHLDGSFRAKTVFELGQAKGILPEGCYSEHDVVRHSTIERQQKNLDDYLSCFGFSGKMVKGDREAIERVAYEACEDKFNDGVRYIEFRYSPHLLQDDAKQLSLKDVIQCVERGFNRATETLNQRNNAGYPPFKTAHILCGIWSFKTWLDEVIDCALELDPGHYFISAVDLAGGYPHSSTWRTDEEAKSYEVAFRRARENGLKVTVHAGECLGAGSVDWAITDCGANRVGHGYRVTEDPDLANRVLPKSSPETRHCEFCPMSSILTNAQHSWDVHVLNKLKPDTSNISLSTDDPGVQLNTLSTEYRICSEKFGWDKELFVASNMNALDAAFSKHVTAEYKTLFMNSYNDL